MMMRKRLNFIPKELRPKLEIPHEILPASLLLIALFYVMMGPLRIAYETRANQKELAELQSLQDDLDRQVKSLTDEKKVADQNSESFKAIEKVLSRKNYWSEIFKEMSMVIPDGVWLTHFTHLGVKGSGKSATPAPLSPASQLLVKGEATSQLGVAKFLTILEKSHYFSGARLISSERMKDIKPTKFKFEFTIPVRAGVGGKG